MSREKSECCEAELWDVDCPECYGDGYLPDSDFEECTYCEGRGYMIGEAECSSCGETYNDPNW